jgi:hypothetical protein
MRSSQSHVALWVAAVLSDNAASNDSIIVPREFGLFLHGPLPRAYVKLHPETATVVAPAYNVDTPVSVGTEAVYQGNLFYWSHETMLKVAPMMLEGELVTDVSARRGLAWLVTLSGKALVTGTGKIATSTRVSQREAGIADADTSIANWTPVPLRTLLHRVVTQVLLLYSVEWERLD